MEVNQKIEQIATIAYSFKDTVYHSYHTARQQVLNCVEGDFVECGVAAGAQVAAMQQALLELNALDEKKIWAFDSFEGIPLAGPNDTEQPGIVGAIQHDTSLPEKERLKSSGITVHSENNFVSNLARFFLPMSNIRIVKGWFQNTLPEKAAAIEKISLLRLDGDLYESTMVCLEYLYPKVVSGGVVIIDDYALLGCRKAVMEYFIKNNFTKELTFPPFIEVEGGGGVVWFKKSTQ